MLRLSSFTHTRTHLLRNKELGLLRRLLLRRLLGGPRHPGVGAIGGVLLGLHGSSARSLRSGKLTSLRDSCVTLAVPVTSETLLR